jgi:hypothetical protein
MPMVWKAVYCDDQFADKVDDLLAELAKQLPPEAQFDSDSWDESEEIEDDDN